MPCALLGLSGLAPPPRPVTQQSGRLLSKRLSHSRETNAAPLINRTLINRTRAARDSISPHSPAVISPSFPSSSAFPSLVLSFVSPYHRPPSFLPTPFLRRFYTRGTRTPCERTTRLDSPRVSHGPDRFSRPRLWTRRRFRRTAHRCSQVSCETCSNSERQNKRENERELEREEERERERKGKRKTTKHDPLERY